MRSREQNFAEEVEFMKNHDFEDQKIIEYLQAHPSFKGDPKQFVDELTENG